MRTRTRVSSLASMACLSCPMASGAMGSGDMGAPSSAIWKAYQTRERRAFTERARLPGSKNRRKPGTDGTASEFPAKGAGNPWQSRQSPEGTRSNGHPAITRRLVGRPPKSGCPLGQDALVPLPEQRHHHLAERQQADGPALLAMGRSRQAENSADPLPWLICTFRKSTRRRWWWIWISWSAIWPALPATLGNTSFACGRTLVLPTKNK